MASRFSQCLRQDQSTMMVSALEAQGYRVWTIGRRHCWMKIGSDGYLHAITRKLGSSASRWNRQPHESQRDGSASSQHHLTNVALTPENEPWWEASGGPPPSGLINWKGIVGILRRSGRAPNSRYTVPASNLPSISSQWESEGVPISAFIFGGRRERMGHSSTNPSTGSMARSWAPRWDPRPQQQPRATSASPAAIPWPCCLSAGTTWQTTSALVDMGKKIPHPPKFSRELVRRGSDGKFLWPGYGETCAC